MWVDEGGRRLALTSSRRHHALVLHPSHPCRRTRGRAPCRTQLVAQWAPGAVGELGEGLAAGGLHASTGAPRPWCSVCCSPGLRASPPLPGSLCPGAGHWGFGSSLPLPIPCCVWGPTGPNAQV